MSLAGGVNVTRSARMGASGIEGSEGGFTWPDDLPAPPASPARDNIDRPAVLDELRHTVEQPRLGAGARRGHQPVTAGDRWAHCIAGAAVGAALLALASRPSAGAVLALLVAAASVGVLLIPDRLWRRVQGRTADTSGRR
jgi:hypothetical protein